MSPDTTFQSERNSFARRLVTTVVVVIAILLVWFTLHIFLLLFMGVIFGIFLHKTGALIADKTHIGVRWGTVITIGGLIAATLAALTFMAPQITAQTEQLVDQLPGSWQQAETTIARTRMGEWVMGHLPSLQQIAGSIGGLMHRATAWIYSAVGALFSTLIIIVLGVYLAFDVDTYTTGIERLVPAQHRPRAMLTLDSLGSTLYWWLLGRLFSMLIIAMPAALILAAQLIMGSIQGVIGLLVATPLTAGIMVMVRHLYIEAVLGDPPEHPAGSHAQDSGPVDNDASG